jgi:hypothetical protein
MFKSFTDKNIYLFIFRMRQLRKLSFGEKHDLQVFESKNWSHFFNSSDNGEKREYSTSVDFNKAYYSLKREVLYSILIKYGYP